MSKQNSVITKISELLNSHLFDHMVAGGYPRNLHFGLPAKDVDFCIYNFHPNDYAELMLLQQLYNLLSDPAASEEIGDEVISISLHGRIFGEGGTDYGYMAQSIAGVIKLHFKETLPVDLIFREDCHPQGGQGMFTRMRRGNRICEERHVVDDFDLSINAFKLNLETFQPEFIGAQEGVCEIVNGFAVSPKRALRFAKMAEQNGWEVSQTLKCFIGMGCSDIL